MLRIGLTGGVGSGKSTVSRFFEDLNVPVIDADQVAREVVQPGAPALKAIEKLFGASVVLNGQLDRGALRDRIFRDATAREALEAILHPLIRSEIRSRLAATEAPYCVIAIPLLVEKGWESEVDRVLLIDSSQDHQVERTQARDGITREAAESILRAQATREERLAKADDVIENNGDLTELRRQVEIVHQRYFALAKN